MWKNPLKCIFLGRWEGKLTSREIWTLRAAEGNDRDKLIELSRGKRVAAGDSWRRQVKGALRGITGPGSCKAKLEDCEELVMVLYAT